METQPDCTQALERIGDQAGELTGYTGRVARALAHLREAFLVADEENELSIRYAIAVLVVREGKPAPESWFSILDADHEREDLQEFVGQVRARAAAAARVRPGHNGWKPETLPGTAYLCSTHGRGDTRDEPCCDLAEKFLRLPR